MNGSIKKEFGDYQTPYHFATLISKIVADNISFYPTLVVEPTCGVGNFLLASNHFFENANLIGIDINDEYLSFTKKSLVEKGYDLNKCKIIKHNIFEYDYDENLNNDDNILIIGNPPWATNSNLTGGMTNNLPIKSNFKNFNGFDALTGSSNFDICEYIILDVFRKVQNKNIVLAMLCKTTVAINVIKELKRQNIAISKGFIVKFNTKEIFDVSVDACLLYIEILKENKISEERFSVYTLEGETTKYQTDMGFIEDDFFTDISNYVCEFDGISQFEWRQGVKHDSSKVMELTKDLKNRYVNGFNKIVDIEDCLVYPLLKSSDIKKYALKYKFRKYVIITQKKVGEPTDYIENYSPKLWKYLSTNRDILFSRKSSIYKNAPEFSIFGIGDYSFSEYKVAISGFYKEPIFKMISDDKPVMLDDTCYFLSFENKKQAMITTIILNSDIAKSFLYSIVNLNSKRPYTKKILSRINLFAISQQIDYEYIRKREWEDFYSDIILKEDYNSYKNEIR